MNALTPKKTVAAVIKAIEAKETDEVISSELVSTGVSPADAPNIVASVREGFKAGVQSKVMGTRAHPAGDQYYLIAFAEGRFTMRFTSPGWVLLRRVFPYLIAAAILAFLLWRFVF